MTYVDLHLWFPGASFLTWSKWIQTAILIWHLQLLIWLNLLRIQASKVSALENQAATITWSCDHNLHFNLAMTWRHNLIPFIPATPSALKGSSNHWVNVIPVATSRHVLVLFIPATPSALKGSSNHWVNFIPVATSRHVSIPFIPATPSALKGWHVLVPFIPATPSALKGWHVSIPFIPATPSALKGWHILVPLIPATPSALKGWHVLVPFIPATPSALKRWHVSIPFIPATPSALKGWHVLVPFIPATPSALKGWHVSIPFIPATPSALKGWHVLVLLIPAAPSPSALKGWHGMSWSRSSQPRLLPSKDGMSRSRSSQPRLLPSKDGISWSRSSQPRLRPSKDGMSWSRSSQPRLLPSKDGMSRSRSSQPRLRPSKDGMSWSRSSQPRLRPSKDGRSWSCSSQPRLRPSKDGMSWSRSSQPRLWPSKYPAITVSKSSLLQRPSFFRSCSSQGDRRISSLFRSRPTLAINPKWKSDCMGVATLHHYVVIGQTIDGRSLSLHKNVAARVGIIGYESNLIKWIPCELKWTKICEFGIWGVKKAWSTQPHSERLPLADMQRMPGYGGLAATRPLQCDLNSQTLGSGRHDPYDPWKSSAVVSKSSKESGIKWNLVGGFNPSEKYARHLGLLFPIHGKIKNVPKHQPEKILAAGNTFLNDFWLR